MMKRLMGYISIVGVMIFGFFAFGSQNTEASGFGPELENLEKQKVLQKYEEVFGPIKRAATEEEIEEIDKAIEEKLKTNSSFTIKGILEELGLEDVGYQEPDSSNQVDELAINFGSLGFRNPSHTSSTFSATLQFTNIGFTKLDSLNCIITPYTKTTGGGWVQNGDWQYVAETQLIVGTTILGHYSAPHSNRGAKLEAAGVIVDKGEGTVLSPASAIYNPK